MGQLLQREVEVDGRIFQVEIERCAKGGFVASVSKLPECTAEADDITAVLDMTRRIIRDYLDSLPS